MRKLIVIIMSIAMIVFTATMLSSCGERELQVYNKCSKKEGKGVTGKIHDVTITFMYDKENIGQVNIGDIEIDESAKVSVPKKATKYAIIWCAISKENKNTEKIPEELHNIIVKFSTVGIPNFTYLEEKGDSKMVIDDNLMVDKVYY